MMQQVIVGYDERPAAAACPPWVREPQWVGRVSCRHGGLRRLRTNSSWPTDAKFPLNPELPQSYAFLRSRLFWRSRYLGHSRLAAGRGLRRCIAVYVDLGQPCEDRDAILKKARDCGAASARIVDAREELCRDFAFPVLGWQAKYEGIYLLGTSIARPLIAKVCLQVAREVGATAFAHGATGKGNDQCRFQLAAEALEPGIKIIAPWRIKKYRDKFPGRTEMIDYCAAKKIPVKASISKPYSSDENCLHISYEAGKLEDPAVDGISIIDFGMTVSPQDAPDKVEEVTSRLRAGRAGDAQRQAAVGAGDGRGDEQDRRPQWRGADRHRRESLRRHEEPRRVRSARHDGSLRGPPGDRATDARPRHGALARSARRRKWPRWCTTASGSCRRWTR